MSVRRNGLPAASFSPIGDVDPRLADEVLRRLAEAGLAADAAPSPGVTGGYLDVRLPTRPSDRVWADSGSHVLARQILRAAVAESGESLDEEAAFDAIVRGFDAPSDAPVPPWPVMEDADVAISATRLVRPAEPAAYEIEEEHFIPPPPPPVPKPHPVTRRALYTMGAGGALLIGAGAIGYQLSGWLLLAAILAVLVGGATLVIRMKDKPPTDSGWDDGAVV